MCRAGEGGGVALFDEYCGELERGRDEFAMWSVYPQSDQSRLGLLWGVLILIRRDASGR